MKLLFLSHHWTNNSHHSLHSGFQRLVQFAAADHEVTLVTWADREYEYLDVGANGRPIRVITVKSGRRDFLFQRRIAISRKGATLAPAFDAVHALYEDCTFALPPNRFTTTFHVLPGVVHYKEPKHRLFLFLKYHVLQRRALRNAASIACVSTNLLSAISQPYRKKATFIPHGVDTDFWSPALASTQPDNYMLCVGAHGLDRPLLTNFIRANPGRQFIIVGLRPQLDPFPNTRYLYHISDEDLRELYAGATLLIRPLQFATANNSVLEALSMGKTIVASRIPGITDYLNEKTGIFIDTLPNHSLDNIRPLDPALIRQYTIDSFSWQKVLAEYLKIYQHPVPATSNHTHG
ncbi:MAG TPA: glycosyltransferase family 4 protein [Puia sp.]|nr:glycosyltransferase family 4 protein [Puia sp.]